MQFFYKDKAFAISVQAVQRHENMLTESILDVHEKINLAGSCVLGGQQEEIVDLLLQYLLDANPCCNPYVESVKASSSPLPKRTKCVDGESVHSTVLDQKKNSALKTSVFLKHENLPMPQASTTADMLNYINRREHSVDDGQLACAQNSLPPPMPFVRNARSHGICYVVTAPARQEYNKRIGQLLDAERLHVLSTNRRKSLSNLM